MQTAYLEHTNTVILAHNKTNCKGQYCSLHNRSNHHMRHFPQNWRNDCNIMERICPHGVGHPDPDCIGVKSHDAKKIHGCDGCCTPSILYNEFDKE